MSALQQRLGGASAGHRLRFHIPSGAADDSDDPDREEEVGQEQGRTGLSSTSQDERVVQDAIDRARSLGSFTQWVKAQTTMDKRTLHEASALADVIDHLLAGRSDQALSSAVLRLVAIQTATQLGNWAVADVICHRPPSDSLLAPDTLRTVFRNASALQRLEDRAASASRRRDRGDHKPRDRFNFRDRSSHSGGHAQRRSTSNSGHRFRGSSHAGSSSASSSSSAASSHQRSGQGNNNNNAGAREQ